jgi:threonyl-tRNA synthetase
MAILIEHYAGKTPFWLNPKQAMICTVSDNFNSFAGKVQKRRHYEGFQVNISAEGSTLPKKVRNAQIEQYNYSLVIGQEEVNANCVDVRSRDGERIGKFTIDNLIELFRSLEPKMSKTEELLTEKIKEPCFGHSETEIDQLEARLKSKLFLSGEELGEEDKKVYETYKDQEICKGKYPNLSK